MDESSHADATGSGTGAGDKQRNVARAVNKAVAVNSGRSGGRTSVSVRQRIVKRDGKTTVVEERTERREA